MTDGHTTIILVSTHLEIQALKHSNEIDFLTLDLVLNAPENAIEGKKNFPCFSCNYYRTSLPTSKLYLCAQLTVHNVLTFDLDDFK